MLIHSTSSPKWLFQSHSNHWGIGARLTWVLGYATITSKECYFDIKVPTIEGNVFDLLFDKCTIDRYSASNKLNMYESTIKQDDRNFNHPYTVNEYITNTNDIQNFRRCSRNFKLNNDLTKRSDQLMKSYDRVLGIHYRGTDKSTDNKLVSYDYIIDLIKKWSPGYDAVLLCTDEKKLYNMARNLDKVIGFDNHIRSELCYDLSADIRATIGLHHRGFGLRHVEEAVVEIRALGMCNHVLMARSCFADAALMWSLKDSSWNYYR